MELLAHRVATEGRSIDAEQVLLRLCLEFHLRQGCQFLAGLVFDALEVPHHLVLVRIHLHDAAGVAVHEEAFRDRWISLSNGLRFNWTGASTNIRREKQKGNTQIIITGMQTIKTNTTRIK